MPRIPGLRRVFRLATRHAPVNDDVDTEVAFHLEMTAAELEARGMPPHLARAEAQRRFGDVEAKRAELRRIDGERERATRAREWLDGLAQDVRVAARALRRSPGLSAVIVLTLALGIGANTMMFGIVDRLLLRPPAYVGDASRMGRVFLTRAASGDVQTFDHLGYAQLRDLREGTAGVLDLAAVTSWESVIGDGAAARQAEVAQASGEMWSMFDAKPALGRFFGPQDDRLPAGAPVAVLGYEYWQQELGGDPSALGRAVRIADGIYTVIGIAPRDFTGVGLKRVDAWVPLTTAAASGFPADFATSYNMTWFQVIARRHAGVSAERANAALTRAFTVSEARRRASRVAAGREPPRAARLEAALYPIQIDRGPRRSTNARVSLWVLGVAVIVLLVACANVANLLLARAIARSREVAVRVALGVGRARLARQLLAEVLVLAALGAASGLVLARVGSVLVTRVLMPEVAWGDALVDARTLAVTMAIALGAGVLASLAPAVRALRPDIVTRLRGSAREGGAGARRGGTRAVLVLAQAALSALLLVGAGLFVRSLRNVRAVDFGFDAPRVAFVNVELRGAKLDSAQSVALYMRLAAKARELSVVETVGTSVEVPYYQGYSTDRVRLPGRDSVTAGTEIHGNIAGLDHFAAMGTRVLRGRVWDPRGAGADEEAIVISERLARVLWPNEDAIGKCAIVDEKDDAPCRTVIGVVQDLRLRGDPRERGVPSFYRALASHPGPYDISGLMIRTRGDVSAQLLALHRALQPLAPGAAYVSVRSVADLQAPELRPWQLGATLFAAFGALGLIVAAVGLYSALAYDVAQRRHDFGVRVALGARPGDVLRLVVGRGVTIAIAGVALGTTLALLAGRYVSTLLYGVSPHDPATLGTVAAVLLTAAGAASVFPALRAARVDPARTLRSE